LKKEPKNFCPPGLSPSGKAEAQIDKSFLLLFFKKEGLPSALSLLQPATWAVTGMQQKTLGCWH
jgi:hypothetical protein